MRKKLAVLFLGAALTVSMLGACGGKDAASSSASAVRIRQITIQTAICSMSMKQKKERVS